MAHYPKAMRWEDGGLVLLDQTKLPTETTEVRCTDVDQVVDCIKRLVVRGAPAIGVAAAYGVALGAANGIENVAGDIEKLAASRPTAINLFWALERMKSKFDDGADAAALLEEAKAIEEDDVDRCKKIGEYGARLLPDKSTIIT